MPSSTSAVGGLTLPVPAGVLNGSLVDPTVAGLIDYLAWSLKADLDGKFAQMLGTSHDACPTANRYQWDPSTHFVRNSFPALYVWWDGTSRRAEKRQTLLYDVMEREIRCCYIFDELAAPSGIRARSGLLWAINASLAKACERTRYSTYAPPGNAAGTTLLQSLSLLNMEYMGATRGEMKAAIPEGSARAGGPPTGHEVRGYPAIEGRILVWERIELDTPADPGDLLTDTLLHVDASDGAPEVVDDFIQRYLPAPDGDEQP